MPCFYSLSVVMCAVVVFLPLPHNAICLFTIYDCVDFLNYVHLLPDHTIYKA